MTECPTFESFSASTACLGAQIDAKFSEQQNNITAQQGSISALQGAVAALQSQGGGGGGGVTPSTDGCVTPETFGCVGDGSPGDGPGMALAIQEAINEELPLSLRCGATYYLDQWAPITQTGPLTIRGNGAILRGSDTPSETNRIFLAPTEKFDIQNVRFENWNAILLRRFPASGSITGAKFCHNEVTGFTQYGINIEIPFYDSHISNNRMWGCTGYCFIKIGKNDYSVQDTWARNTIHNNKLNGLTGVASSSLFAVLIFGMENDCSFNDIRNCLSVQGECVGIYGKQRWGKYIANTIVNMDSQGTTGTALDVGGLNIKGAPVWMTTSGVQGFSCTASKNIIRKIGTAGVRGYGMRLQTSGNIASDNTVEDFGRIGIAIDDPNGSDNNKIVDNTVLSREIFGDYAGISLETYGKRHKICGNTIQVACDGVKISPIYGNLRSISLIDNSISVSGAGSAGVRFENGSFSIASLKVVENDFGISAHCDAAIASEKMPLKVLQTQNDFVDCMAPYSIGPMPSGADYVSGRNIA